jgi:hypothetical protein
MSRRAGLVTLRLGLRPFDRRTPIHEQARAV